MKKRQQLEEAEATEKYIIAVENREMAQLVNAESEGSMNRFMMKNLISKVMILSEINFIRPSKIS